MSLDLKDAYFHVPVLPDHRHFLRFSVAYHSLSLAPQVFTRYMTTTLSSRHLQGIKNLPYLDDWPEGTALIHVTTLGFTVNNEKSNFTQSPKVTFIGKTLTCKNDRQFT